MQGVNMKSPKRPAAKSARYLALQCLQRWARGGAFAETLVDNAACEAQLSPADRALLQAIVYNTLRHQSWLTHICYKLRPSGLEESLGWLVLSGLCQLFIMEQAQYAVVSESVDLAPPRARALINAMLREALRQKENLLAERDSLSLATRYSCPDWLVQRWVAEWGQEQVQALLQWNVQTPPLYARLNPLNPMESIPETWEALEGEGLASWYKINGPLPVDALKAGQVYVADPSTRHCISLLAPQKGERILDACAAPGGKCAAILAATQGDVELLATDLHPHRLSPLRENLQRAGGQNITVSAHDWTQPCPQDWQEAFDAVLLDVPCSNAGVLPRRVDARWRLSAEELTRLANLQLSILEQGAAAVRPGGRLVYSTCSIDREENQDNVARFLAAHPDFELVDESLALPHIEKADGAYAALLRCK